MHEVRFAPQLGGKHVFARAIREQKTARQRALVDTYVQLRQTSHIRGAVAQMYMGREVMCADLGEGTRVMYTHVMVGSGVRVLIQYVGL